MTVAPSVMLAWVINWVILLIPVPVAGFLVGRDAWRKGETRLGTAVWVMVSIFTFPIGVGLYLALGKRSKKTGSRVQEKKDDRS